jgi:hypothetical protein
VGREGDELQTILEILRLAGQLTSGFCISIENEPYMRLVIEDIQIPGPDVHPSLSVAHYGEQNGDAMRDPEMLFELVEISGQIRLVPYYFRNDYVGVEQYSRLNQDGVTLVRPQLFREHRSFARLWDRNLRAQGFVEAFQRMKTAEAPRQ